MKVYSIGREMGCDIVINDNSYVISSRHATLNVAPSGKMTIVDLSHNGTYVNGIRIAQNVPVPVTRKDNVSFAHVARLDWNLIPNTSATIMKWGIIGIVALLVIIGAVWGFSSLSKGDTPANEQPIPVAVDSLNKVKQRSSGKAATKKVEPKKAEPKKAEPKKEEPTTKRVRG